MLEFRQLTKYFSWDAPAIDALNFDVNDGEVVGFVGSEVIVGAARLEQARA